MLEQKSHQKSLRRGRFDESGFYYFLTTVTKKRRPIFLESTAAQIVLNSLKWLDDNDRIALIAAVVMPDHVHFIVELKSSNLVKLMHSLKSYTANEINRVLGQNGHVWESQYYERGIKDESSLNSLIRYCL
ncbi:MAG: transposase, partial [Candidatus Dadabacteria bacterium]|nr:transposase [Candidatus Dadabacteria bacterium]